MRTYSLVFAGDIQLWSTKMIDKKTTTADEALEAARRGKRLESKRLLEMANEVLSKANHTMMELFPGLLIWENMEEAIRMEREAIAAAMPELKRQIALVSACIELAGKSLLEGKEIDNAEGINREILLFVIQFRYVYGCTQIHLQELKSLECETETLRKAGGDLKDGINGYNKKSPDKRLLTFEEAYVELKKSDDLFIEEFSKARLP